MKVSLIVASGVHEGKVVPIIGSQFLVGRDPQCQLRPASQAVSKQHCAVLLRDGKVFLQDFGSTNGTILNEDVVQGDERQLNDNDSLKIGPLDFTVRIEMSVPKEDGTPLPDLNPEGVAALAAVKAVASRPSPASKNATPTPSSLQSPTPQPGSKESPALQQKAAAKKIAAATDDESDNDRLAAMLLGLDDGEVPGGSTVVDVPVPAELSAEGGTKPPEKKAIVSREDTSNAASDILRRYMRRPR